MAVAVVANLALAPGDAQLIGVTEVQPEAYFTPEQIERGREYRRPQAVLGLLGLAAQVALLAWLARRLPRRLQRAARRPVWGAAAAGAAVSVALTLASLPFSVVARLRARDVGLSTDAWLQWARDLLISTAIGALFAAILAAGAVALIRRLPRLWWVPASGLAVLAAAVLVFSGPLVLDPLFNDFEELEGPRRATVVELAERAGVRVDEVFVMDASRRTTAANAYVTGLGGSKRVVIYDNLLDNFRPEEVRSLIAHELAHQRYDDVPRGLLYFALVAPAGLLGVALVGRRVAGERLGTAAGVPALALAFVLLSTGLTWASSALSRQVEARADAFALRLTGDADALIGLQRRLAVRNRSDVDPPAVLELLSTHPPTIKRIGMAETVR